MRRRWLEKKTSTSSSSTNSRRFFSNSYAAPASALEPICQAAPPPRTRTSIRRTRIRSIRLCLHLPLRALLPHTRILQCPSRAFLPPPTHPRPFPCARTSPPRIRLLDIILARLRPVKARQRGDLALAINWRHELFLVCPRS